MLVFPFDLRCLARCRKSFIVLLAFGVVSPGIVSAQKPKLIFKARHKHSTRIVLSPDSKLVLTDMVAPNATIKVWDIAKRSARGTLKVSSVITAADFVFSPDGKTLATCTAEKRIKLWDFSKGTLAGTLDYESGSVDRLAFSPDGKRLLSSDMGTPASIRVWDVETRRVIRVFDKQPKTHVRVRSVHFSPDGKRVAATWTSGHVVVWDVETGKKHLGFRPHDTFIYTFAFSPDGRRIATAGNKLDPNRIVNNEISNSIKLWDAETGELKSTLFKNRTVGEIAYSPDGNILAVGLSTGIALVQLDHDSDWIQDTLMIKGARGYLRYSRDGKILAALGTNGLAVWDVSNLSFGAKETDNPEGTTENRKQPDKKAKNAGPFKTGNTLIVSQDDSPLIFRAKVIARLSKGTEVKIIRVTKDKIFVTTQTAGKTKRGWLKTAQLAAPQAEVQEDSDTSKNDEAAVKKGTGAEELQGKWKCIGTKTGGNDFDGPHTSRSLTFTFKGNRMIVVRDDPSRPTESEFRLDASKNPKQIDTTTPRPDGGKGHAKYIYQIKGDILTLSVHPSIRPTKFTATNQDENLVIILKRVKTASK